MIAWLVPGALAGLALIAAPLIVHLLRTHRAERLLFPSLRFVSSSRTASVRLHLPSDWPLLLVRIAIVAAAAFAAAQPVVVTEARVRSWNARQARAVIVDASESMRLTGATAAAEEAAHAQLGPAEWSVSDDAADLDGAVLRAAAWLAAAPPARREIVVISNFRHGALHARAFAAVPPDVGLAFVRVGGDIPERMVPGAMLLGAPGVPARQQEIQLVGPTTRLQLGPGAAAADVGGSASLPPGLRFLTPGVASPATVALWRTVAIAGAPRPSPDEPLVFHSGGTTPGAAPAAVGRSSPRWMLTTTLRLRRDQALARAARAVVALPLLPSDIWTDVATDQGGKPIIRVAALGQELLMQVGAEPDAMIAAAALQALLTARRGDVAQPQEEVLRLEPRAVEAWARGAADVGPDAWRRAETSDARWLWLLAICLLILEHRMRGAAAAAPAQARHAA